MQNRVTQEDLEKFLEAEEAAKAAVPVTSASKKATQEDLEDMLNQHEQAKAAPIPAPALSTEAQKIEYMMHPEVYLVSQIPGMGKELGSKLASLEFGAGKGMLTPLVGAYNLAGKVLGYSPYKIPEQEQVTGIPKNRVYSEVGQLLGLAGYPPIVPGASSLSLVKGLLSSAGTGAIMGGLTGAAEPTTTQEDLRNTAAGAVVGALTHGIGTGLARTAVPIEEATKLIHQLRGDIPKEDVGNEILSSVQSLYKNNKEIDSGLFNEVESIAKKIGARVDDLSSIKRYAKSEVDRMREAEGLISPDNSLLADLQRILESDGLSFIGAKKAGESYFDKSQSYFLSDPGKSRIYGKLRDKLLNNDLPRAAMKYTGYKTDEVPVDFIKEAEETFPHGTEEEFATRKGSSQREPTEVSPEDLYKINPEDDNEFKIYFNKDYIKNKLFPSKGIVKYKVPQEALKGIPYSGQKISSEIVGESPGLLPNYEAEKENLNKIFSKEEVPPGKSNNEYPNLFEKYSQARNFHRENIVPFENTNAMYKLMRANEAPTNIHSVLLNPSNSKVLNMLPEKTKNLIFYKSLARAIEEIPAGGELTSPETLWTAYTKIDPSIRDRLVTDELKKKMESIGSLSAPSRAIDFTKWLTPSRVSLPTAIGKELAERAKGSALLGELLDLPLAARASQAAANPILQMILQTAR